MRRLAMLSLLLLPVAATAQSHNSSTNCSNGRCRRIESWSPNGAPPWMQWQRIEQWREGPRREWRHAPYRWHGRHWPRGRDRDDDD
jgi:hypothetical protein